MPRPAIPDSFFKSWSYNMAYVLGFWWADGNMYQFKHGGYSIEFTSTDDRHLGSVASAMGARQTLVYRDGAHRLRICRKEIFDDISALGGVPAKSLIAVWPKIPCAFLRDFVRGYIDGDGSLSFDGLSRVPCLQIAGTRAFLEGLSRQVYDATGIASSKGYQCKTKCPLIRYTGLKAKCMAAWLYTDSLLSLERKYLLAMEFIRWRPRRFGFKQRVITPQMERLFGEVLYG